MMFLVIVWELSSRNSISLDEVKKVESSNFQTQPPVLDYETHPGSQEACWTQPAALSDNFLYVTMDVINMFTLGDWVKW